MLNLRSGQHSDYEQNMPGIGFVDQMYARNRLCWTISSGRHSDYEENICKE